MTVERYSLNGNSRLRFFASVVNKDYILHLYEIFKSYTKTPPKVVSRKKINKLTGHLQTDIFFSTLKYSYFNFAREEFYKPVVSPIARSSPLNFGEELSLAVSETSKNLVKKCIKVVPADIEKKFNRSRVSLLNNGWWFLF